MSEKLTLEWIHKYYNAKVKHLNNVWEIRSIDFMTEDITLFRYIQYDVLVPQDYKTGNEEVSISDCKLILRPLSSLTDEEKKYIEKNYHHNTKIYWEKVNSMYQLSYVVLREYIAPLSDKLREWNIDFETPSLQERGIAVFE